MSDLTKALDPRIKKAMELTRDEIFDMLRQKVDEYYEETPINGWGTPPYQRTHRLEKAASKSAIDSSNGCFTFTVGFNDEYLSFQYPGWENAGKEVTRGKTVLPDMKY